MSQPLPIHRQPVLSVCSAYTVGAPWLRCRLARACQRLWLAVAYDAYGSSLVLGISSSLVSPTALTLAVAEATSRRSPHLDDGERLSRQLPTRPLPVAPVPIGYCERNRRFGLWVFSYRTIIATTSSRTCKCYTKPNAESATTRGNERCVIHDVECIPKGGIKWCPSGTT